MTRRRSPGPARSLPGRAGRLVRGAVAFCALAGFTGTIPAVLAHYGGWLLPRHVPAWPQVRAALMTPLTESAILKILACAVWLAWAMFAVSLAVEIIAALRGRPAPRMPVLPGAQALAAALVSALTVTAAAVPYSSASLAPAAAASSVAVTTASFRQPGHQAPARLTAPWITGPPVNAAGAGPKAHPWDTSGSSSTALPEIHHVVPGDNLWDIAGADLGNPEQWHEIYALNRGRPQADGRSLTDPDRIYPGWALLLPPLPASAPPVSHPAGPGQGKPAPDGHRPGGHAAGHPRHKVAPPRQRARPVAIPLPGGGLAGITLAAAISAALVTWRLHRRRIAIPRWPITDDPPEPPLPDAIASLRRAHLDSIAADAAEARGEPWLGEDPAFLAAGASGGTSDEDGLDEFGAPAGPQPPADYVLAAPVPLAAAPHSTAPAGLAGPPAAGRDAAGGRPAPPPARPLPAGTVTFGRRGNTEIPLSDVARHGVGLTGPGAPGTARALMVALLAAASPGRRHGGPQVVIEESDARQMAGLPGRAGIAGVSPGLPAGLTIAPTLSAALDHIETEITRRLRARGDNSLATASGAPHDGQEPMPPLALIARPGQRSAHRIQAVLEAGASAGAVGILLGDWPAGVTCYIGADGVVTTAARGGLSGVRAFHLSAGDAADMLSLLRGAGGHVTDTRPGSPPAPLAAAGVPPPRRPAAGPGRGTGDSTAAGSGQGSASERSCGQPQHDEPAPQAAPAAPAPQEAAPLATASGPGVTGALPPDPPAAHASHRTTAAPGPAAPPPAARPVQIRVLGPLRITAGSAEIGGGLRKARELIAYLAICPGSTGAAISEALWPGSSPRYATSQRHLALRKAREMLRTATGLPAPMFITRASDRYQLDATLIDLDLWRFDAALERARNAASTHEQLTALQEAAALYQGPLADGAAYDWAERYAEPARRRAVDTLARIAEILQPDGPEQALTVLEIALSHDPYNEAVYQKIMRIQDQSGRPDAARRTLALLEARLAALGMSPAPATRQAAGIPAGDPPPGRPPPSPRRP